MTYGSDGLDIKNLVFRVDAGRFSLSGHAGSTLALKASAVGLPLAALDLFSPGLGLSGVADGEATIGGTPNNPTGEWRVRLAARDPAANAQCGSARFGRRRLRPARGRSNVARRYHQCRNRQPCASDRLRSARARRGAGREDRRRARRSPRQHHAFRLRASRGGFAGDRASAARNDRETASARRGSPDRRRIQGRSNGIQADRDHRDFVANGDTIRIDRLAGTTPNSGSIGGERRGEA